MAQAETAKRARTFRARIGTRDQSFAVLGQYRSFVVFMAAGSIIGSFIGGQMLGLIPSVMLLQLLALILVISAIKVWRHI